MKTLRFYRVDDYYVSYLHSRDKKVQYNKKAKRPYVGVVFEFAGFKYFVPMESPKPNHDNIKSGKHIMKLKKGEYGLLGFNNMIPVHKDALIPFDINDEKDEKYKRLLQHQYDFCNKKKYEILDHAQKTYFEVTKNKTDFYVKISCDFKKLEKACKMYDSNRRKTL